MKHRYKYYKRKMTVRIMYADNEKIVEKSVSECFITYIEVALQNLNFILRGHLNFNLSCNK